MTLNHTPGIVEFIHGKTGKHLHTVGHAQIVKENAGFALIKEWMVYKPSAAPYFTVRTTTGFMHEFVTRKEALEVYPILARLEA